jgi:hypothetical protein
VGWQTALVSTRREQDRGALAAFRIMSILFYVEPVVYRADPSFLGVWSRWAGQIAKANRIHRRYLLCSSGVLCDEFVSVSGADPGDVAPVSAVDALRDSGFSRVRYGRDLCGTEPQAQHHALYLRLAQIADVVRPEVVISFTENRHVRAAFPKSLVLFTEVGPLPRMGTSSTFFYDPCGHQIESMLNLHAERITRESPRDVSDVDDAWVARQKHLQEHVDYALVKHWIEQTCKGRRVRLLALQPPDWITFEGAYEPIAVEEVIYRQAVAEPDTLLVPTYHPGFRLTQAMEQYITREFPQVAFPPPGLATGRSELFIPHVDEVITISSTVAVMGVLEGKIVRVLGRCAFQRIAEASNAVVGDLESHSALRRNLLAFLSNRYLQPADRILGEPGFFNRLVDSQLGCYDVVESYFDYSDWTIDRLRALLGVP